MRGAVSLFLIAACGGGGDGDRTSPVPSTPLAGTLNGTAWVAGGAKITRSASDETKRTVRIHPGPVGCTGLGPDPYVVVTTPWVPGDVEVDLESDTAIFIFMDATVHIVLDGRLELPAAPTEVGTKALVRVRARFEDDDDDLFVEGQIEAEVCE